MAVATDAKGKAYAPRHYDVGREKIREYALAVGEESAVHFDPEAARAAGFRDVVAPPMFAAVFSRDSVWEGLLDPEVGIDFAMMVHGGQEFVWDEPVCAGDLITTETTVSDVYAQDGKGFYVFESRSRNQDEREVVHGTWTCIVRDR